MTLKSGKRRFSFFFLLIALGLISGCRDTSSTRQTSSNANTKQQIFQYLAKKSGQKQFAPGIDIDLPKHVAALRTNATLLEQRFTALRSSLRATEGQVAVKKQRELQDLERAWESARAEAARKQEELSNQEDTYIRAIRQQMSNTRTYESVYRLVGEQLATADALLAEDDLSRRRMGLKLAREACNHVNSGGVDVWLAGRICEAYFWPNLDIADAQAGSHERALELLEIARRVFFDTYETNSVLKNYELLQANAPNAHAADIFRVQLADWLEEKGDVKRAAEILNEIRDPEVLASARERVNRVRDAVAANR